MKPTLGNVTIGIPNFMKYARKNFGKISLGENLSNSSCYGATMEFEILSNGELLGVYRYYMEPIDGDIESRFFEFPDGRKLEWYLGHRMDKNQDIPFP